MSKSEWKIGDKVSYGFNGDSYPAGEITEISKTGKRIFTSDGTKFLRNNRNGRYFYAKTFGMFAGHVSSRNPSF